MTFEGVSICSEAIVRRMTLRVGEAMAWHVDPCRRYSVVLRGDELTIEFEGGAAPEVLSVHRGMAGWDDPEPRVHRAINSGAETYEELVTFLLPAPDVEPQPERIEPASGAQAFTNAVNHGDQDDHSGR